MADMVYYMMASDYLTPKMMEKFISEKTDNVVFSPYSVISLIALLLDATGGKTREEIVNAIDCEDEEEFIECMKMAVDEFREGGALISSNAICIRKDIGGKITPGYEDRLHDIFDGKLVIADDMVSEVNKWVKYNTHGMIPKLADEGMNEMQACLMNAVTFDAKWDVKYELDDVLPGEFKCFDGTECEVNMMHSREWKYVEDVHFTGFIKSYKEAGYSYMALLPKEEGEEYLKEAVKNIDFFNLFSDSKDVEVLASLPAYRIEFEKDLTDFCKSLGIETAFSPRADFSPMIDEWLKVERILHKTFIQVDNNGTRAAALTCAPVCCGCAGPVDYKEVHLNRPFVFAIMHDDSMQPVFAGIVTRPEGCNPNAEKEIKKKIHEFAEKYYHIFLDPKTTSADVDEPFFGDECARVGFEMDCGKTFTGYYEEKSMYDTSGLMEVINDIYDPMVLGSGIFSKWRYITHWSFCSSCLDEDNRLWFSLALKKLMDLTEEKHGGE